MIRQPLVKPLAGIMRHSWSGLIGFYQWEAFIGQADHGRLGRSTATGARLEARITY